MKIVYIILIIITSLILILFFVRLISPREIDDVTPEISCTQNNLQKADILWVIPEFNNKPISESPKWCKQILSLNKTIGLHSITHSYKEFKSDITQEQLDKAINIFEQCFGFKPTIFKPSHLSINKHNKQLIKNNNLKRKGYFNQIIHKVYHCSDTGRFSNRFIDLF